MKFSFAVFIVVLCTFESTNAWKCPEPDGFFTNPTNPHKYYECVHDVDYEFTCPADLVFNESTGKCDYTTGPVVVHTTTPPPTIPHGDRTRHTDDPHPVTDAPQPTEPVVTRGSHHGDESTVPPTSGPTRGQHEDQSTTQATLQHQPTNPTNQDTTRGRHHETV